MIEQGMVMLIKAGLSSPPSTIGGFIDELPKGEALPSWSYTVASDRSQATLQSVYGLSVMRFQIDVYGNPEAQGADALQLAQAIDVVIRGFRGRLPDPDSTYVDSCIGSDRRSFFDPDTRSYRQMIEYEIWFADQ